MDNFLETYDNSLSKSFCEHLINKFENDNRIEKGSTGDGVNLRIKNSFDLQISTKCDWEEDVSTLHDTLLLGLVKYIRKYPYILLAPLAWEIKDPNDPTGVGRIINKDEFLSAPTEIVRELIDRAYLIDNINLQKYNKTEGHYDYYHSEVYPPTISAGNALARVLVFLWYLNDVEEGGETEFYHQKLKVKPKTGTLALFPPSYTHAHKGNIPVSNDKYILTSWICFRESNDVYGNGTSNLGRTKPVPGRNSW